MVGMSTCPPYRAGDQARHDGESRSPWIIGNRAGQLEPKHADEVHGPDADAHGQPAQAHEGLPQAALRLGRSELGDHQRGIGRGDGQGDG